MKENKINAIVINNFNDKTKMINGLPYQYKKDDIIENMDKNRFEELNSMGYVKEYNKYEVKKINEQVQKQKNNN